MAGHKGSKHTYFIALQVAAFPPWTCSFFRGSPPQAICSAPCLLFTLFPGQHPSLHLATLPVQTHSLFTLTSPFLSSVQSFSHLISGLPISKFTSHLTYRESSWSARTLPAVQQQLTLHSSAATTDRYQPTSCLVPESLPLSSNVGRVNR